MQKSNDVGDSKATVPVAEGNVLAKSDAVLERNYPGACTAPETPDCGFHVCRANHKPPWQMVQQAGKPSFAVNVTKSTEIISVPILAGDFDSLNPGGRHLVRGSGQDGTSGRVVVLSSPGGRRRHDRPSAPSSALYRQDRRTRLSVRERDGAGPRLTWPRWWSRALPRSVA